MVYHNRFDMGTVTEIADGNICGVRRAAEEIPVSRRF